jgi:hypothetical protein
MNNMIAAAIAKRTTDSTKGWAEARPILVAVAAEDHKTANNKPAINHAYFLEGGIDDE